MTSVAKISTLSDPTGLIMDWQVDRVDVSWLRLRAGPARQQFLPADIAGLTGLQHLVEGLKPRPAEQPQAVASWYGRPIRSRSCGGLAVAIAGEFEDQVGPGHVGHGSRQASEQFPQRPEPADTGATAQAFN